MSYVYCIWGPVYSRKSTIAISIAGKKYVFDMERGMHRAQVTVPDEEPLEIWQPNVDISVLTHFKGDRVLGKKEAWQVFTTAYVTALQRDDIDVIIFDTAKEVWTNCHQSVLQEKQDMQWEDAVAHNPNITEDKIEWRKQLIQVEFTMPNERMSALINLARSFGKDLVLINHEREIFGPTIVQGKIEHLPTGKFELDGFKHTLELADWAFLTTKEDVVIDSKVSSSSTKLAFKARVIKCPLGAQVVGQVLTNLTLPAVVNLANTLTAGAQA